MEAYLHYHPLFFHCIKSVHFKITIINICSPIGIVHVCTSTSRRLNHIKSPISLTNACFSNQRSTSPGETKLLASEIYEILQAAGNEEAERAEGEASSCKRKAHFFLGSSNKRAKTVVLHIDGLDDPVSVPPAHVSSSPFSHRTSFDSQLNILIFGHRACCCRDHSVVRMA